MTSVRNLTLILATALLAACAEPPSPPPIFTPAPRYVGVSSAELSKRLAVGMTEEEVRAIKEPDRITMQTCGSQTPRPWQCRVYHYGTDLVVAFMGVRGAWFVNNWH